MDTLAARLKHARDQKGWSQPELARRSGVKQSFIGALEAENQKTSGWLPELAHTLEISAYWLKTGKGPMRPSTALSAEEPRLHYQIDSDAAELAELINQIPEAERKVMLTMLRARFATTRKTRRETANTEALDGFADVTEKSRTAPITQHK